MKSALFAIGAVLVLGAAPAVAQQAQQSQPAPFFDSGAHWDTYSSNQPRENAKRCLDGRFITGVNRSGDHTVYVQGIKGGIYRLKMAEGCDALNDARKISLRSGGSDLVCSGDGAEMTAKTSAGARHCRVTEVQRLTSKQVSTLSTAPRR
jgi:hypothetical protein